MLFAFHTSYYLFLEYSNPSNSNNQTDSRQNTEKQSQPQKEQTPPTARKISDDVFIASDIPVSNEDENHEHINNKEDTTTITRQKSRNWADCPIDESVVDASPPASTNNTLASDDADDFQVRHLYIFCIKQINVYNFHRLFVIKLQNLVQINIHLHVQWVINPCVDVMVGISLVVSHQLVNVPIMIKCHHHIQINLNIIIISIIHKQYHLRFISVYHIKIIDNNHQQKANKD